MKFVDKLLGLIAQGFKAVIDALFRFIEFIAIPLSYLLEFFKGIFYFFYKFFEIAVQIIMIFVAIFQFVLSLIAGVFRFAKSWLTVSPNAGDVSFPSVSNQGFSVITDLLQPTGIMTVVPMVALAFLWFFFILKMIAMFGGTVMVTPFGKGGSQ